MYDFADLSPADLKRVRRAADAKGITVREFLRLLQTSQSRRLAAIEPPRPTKDEPSPTA